jgi:TetR/AcrR family transcriptional regulator
LLAELARSVYHHYAFAAYADGELDVVKDRMWRFCLGALGGAIDSDR